MELQALQSLALSVASARSPDAVLKEVVQGLGMTPGVALARVWLIKEEPGATAYLELKASIGASIVNPAQRWNRTDGAHQQLPLSYGKVGRIATSNQPILLQRGPGEWLLQRDWADAEGIESFAGQPLTFKGQVLGVVAFFSRHRLDKHDLDWLRVFADHAAVAIANARAFEEIARLKEHAERERDYLREAVRGALQHGEIIAESPRMQHVLSQVKALAPSDASVLVLGESGVGKELIATAVHDLSRRRNGPFVKVNCAAVPRELFESEFFGHVRGAFSGAARDRQGRFLLADRGTLFLDEVGEIPLELQGKLLRVLQEGKFEPVGDDRTRGVDVRVISATNRSLEREVERGTFRRDLFYRLGVLPLEIPPLRERREDILPMAQRFLRETARRLNVEQPRFSEDDKQALLSYSFPGNVRELQNVIERAVVLQGHSQSVRLQLGRGSESERPPRVTSDAFGADSTEAKATNGTAVMTAEQLRELERSNMLNALRLCDWQVSGPAGAAQLLGVAASTFSYRMKQLGIVRPGENPDRRE